MTTGQGTAIWQDRPGRPDTATRAGTPMPSAEGQPRTWAVVLQWNNVHHTVRCLDSLRRLTGPRPRILVVDNGSTDGSVTTLQTAFPGVEVVELGWNTGFSAGNNVGVRRARDAGATYVWLVNNDAEVEPGALEAMLQVADGDPTVGAVGSVIVSPADGRTVEVWGGGFVNRSVGRATHARGVPPASRTDYLIGASLLLRLAAVGVDTDALDEGFFLYWEDIDLCYRLRASGWRLAVAERSVVRHASHGSLDRQDPSFDFHYHASAVRFFRRHAPFPLAPIVIGAASRVVLRVASGRWRRAWAVVRGTAAGLARRAPNSRRLAGCRDTRAPA